MKTMSKTYIAYDEIELSNSSAQRPLDYRDYKRLLISHMISYTKMLLMGMWINFTKNPMKPIIAKPIAVAKAIF